MTTSREAELNTDLKRAHIRLSIIARMAQLNMEEAPREQEFSEVMQSILAACGVEEEH